MLAKLDDEMKYYRETLLLESDKQSAKDEMVYEEPKQHSANLADIVSDAIALRTIQNINVPTIIKNSKIDKIYTFSDVHGDPDALIILLRDCARVIRKKIPVQVHSNVRKDLYENEYDPELYDHELNKFYTVNLDELGVNLLEDISSNLEYSYDWNYEWCGDKSYVVIIGDLIDLYRSSIENVPDIHNMGSNSLKFEYVQIELKIIKFLNEIDKQAQRSGGRVIKLLGNHEMMNFFGNNLYHENAEASLEQYITPHMKQLGNRYYRGISRKRIFNIGQDGFKLFKQGGGIRTLLQINSNIFVHGQLTGKSKEYHIALNDWFNNNEEYVAYSKEFLNCAAMAFNEHQGNHLWWREYGDPTSIDQRFYNEPTRYDKYRKYLSELNIWYSNFIRGIEDTRKDGYFMALNYWYNTNPIYKFDIQNSKKLEKHALDLMHKWFNTKYDDKLNDHITHAKRNDYLIALNELFNNVCDEEIRRYNQEYDSMTSEERRYNFEKELIEYRKDKPFCTRVNEDIKNFCSTDKTCIMNANKMRIIIGHCQQHYVTLDNQSSRTFGKITNDGNRQILEAPVYAGKSRPDIGIAFGVTMECPTHGSYNHQIYRVDCGMARSFDNINSVRSNAEYFKHFLSRTPQLLFINEKAEIKVVIIRSNLDNTKNHQHRPWYFDAIISRQKYNDLDSLP